MKVQVFTVGPFQENTYLYWDENVKKTMIIDPGGGEKEILAFIKSEGLEVEAIINTHGHIDHIAGVMELQGALGIPFKIHKDDAPMVMQAEASAGYFGMSFEGSPKIDGYLSEEEAIPFGDSEIKVLHTPGHSPGGICFLHETNVFVGDTLFQGSIGRSDLPGGSHQTLINSIKTQLLSLDDNIIVLPGHGPTTTIGRERTSNPFLW